MERIRRGFRLLRASWQVLMADKELLVLPLISFVCILAVAAPLSLGVYGLGLPDEGESLTVMQYVFMGVFYFAATFIGVFFNAAIVGAAMIRLQGGDPTARDGMRMAARHMDKILGWSLLTATVGIILRSLEERAGVLGRIVIGFIGAAWGVVTFFVVPVLLFEEQGVGGSVKRSASLFKQRWGEQFVGNGSIGIATVLIGIPLVFISIMLAMVIPVVGIAFGVLSFGALIVIGNTLSGIFNAALYRFAVTGAPAGTFTAEDLGGSFTPKRSRRGGSSRGGSSLGGTSPGGFSGNGF